MWGASQAAGDEEPAARVFAGEGSLLFKLKRLFEKKFSRPRFIFDFRLGTLVHPRYVRVKQIDFAAAVRETWASVPLLEPPR